MDAELKNTILFSIAIMLICGLIGGELALLYGIGKLEQKIIWQEKDACNVHYANLIDNREETLLCNLGNTSLAVDRLGKPTIAGRTWNNIDAPVEKTFNVTFPTTPTNTSQVLTVDDKQNGLPNTQ